MCTSICREFKFNPQTLNWTLGRHSALRAGCKLTETLTSFLKDWLLSQINGRFERLLLLIHGVRETQNQVYSLTRAPFIIVVDFVRGKTTCASYFITIEIFLLPRRSGSEIILLFARVMLECIFFLYKTKSKNLFLYLHMIHTCPF